MAFELGRDNSNDTSVAISLCGVKAKMYADIPFWRSLSFMPGGLAVLAWSSDVFVEVLDHLIVAGDKWTSCVRR